MSEERRNVKRSRFTYYMRVLDNNTQNLVGYLIDISSKGFQLDSPQPIPVNRDYNLRLDLTSDISEKAFIVFTARSRWSRPDSSDPSSHDAGFQIIKISSSDDVIFQRIVTKYGSLESTW